MSDIEDRSNPSSPAQRDLFSDSDNEDGGRHRRASGDNDKDRRDGEDSGEEEARKEREEKKKKGEEKKKKPKGPVRRQMISEDMLTGKNGIIKLPEIFKDFQFRGKGREKDDLNNILANLEYWTHNLHSKNPFDQCLQRIEFIGLKKKVVKTHLKKLRMNMLHYDDVVRHEDMEFIDEPEEDETMLAPPPPESAASVSEEFISPLIATPVAGNHKDDEEFQLEDVEEFQVEDEEEFQVEEDNRIPSNNEHRNNVGGFSNKDDGFPDDEDFLALCEGTEPVTEVSC